MSEQPSNISTLPQRETLPALLLDENLCSSDIGELLRRFPKEWQIELHSDHLSRGVSDVEVIKMCAARNWTLVSCDDRIRYVPQNKAAVLDNRVRAFMFGKGNYQGVEYAAALIVGRGQVLNTIRRIAGPFFARIQRSGEVTLLEPKESTTDLSSKEKTARKYGRDVINKNA
jgi:hypothetical protein